MFSLEESINIIKKQRLIFHSEDDLKFSLAFAIKNSNPDFHIRLERPVNLQMTDRNNKSSVIRAPIDILIIDDNGMSIPIELKYKTKKVNITHDGEEYLLTKHGANDVGRYCFRKDIYRIEKYIQTRPNSEIGYVFMLTNDESYFEKNVLDKNSIDKHFSLHHGGLINLCDRSWNYNNLDKTKYIFDGNNNIWKHSNRLKKHWTCEKDLFYKLDLLYDYQIEWKDYSKIGNSIFKYCLIKVQKYC